MFNREEAFQETKKYFNGDELASNVFLDKYALKDNNGNLLEKTPTDMHWRIASEFARIEKTKFKNPLSKEEIFNYLDKFRYIIPQGSPMFGIGNNYQIISLSNCYVTESPVDSYGGILKTDQQLVQISKRRGGVGTDLDNLRPSGSITKNAARSSTGITSWMRRYSNSIRETGQCVAEGQMVLTKRGLIEIEKIREEEDFVWTKVGWVKVLNLIENGKKEIYEVESSAGYTIKTTEEHLYQTFDNNGVLIEEPLRNLKNGDNIVLCLGTDNQNLKFQKLEKSNYKNINKKPLNCEYPIYLEEKLAYIIGYSYGDGSVEVDEFGEKALDLACANKYPKIKEKIKKYCFEIFKYNIKTRKGDGDLERLTIHNKSIVQFLKINSLLKQKAGELIFPKKISESPISIKMAFFSGFFDADGYVSGRKKGYSLSSIDKFFLQEIQKILLSIGILSKFHTEEREKKGWKTIYSLCVVGKCSKEKLFSLCGESCKISSFLLKAKKDHWLTPFKSKSFNIKHNNFSFCPDNSSFLSLNVVKKLKSVNSSVIDVLVQDKIKKITPCGMAKTYDLAIEKEHFFWCEGFYIHNSGRRGALMLTISIHHPDSVYIDENEWENPQKVVIKGDSSKGERDIITSSKYYNQNNLDFCNIKLNRQEVTGANVSIKLTDEFLEAVKNNKKYEQRFPIDYKEKGIKPLVSKMVDAKKVWEKIIHIAWQSAEPGLLFWNRIIDYNSVDIYKDSGFETVSTNPCCFASSKDVWVITNNGYKEIKTITKDDLIWVDVKQKWAKTSGYFTVGKYPVYDIIFFDKSSLRVTNNHKLFVYRYLEGNKFIELKDIKINDDIITNQYDPITGLISCAETSDVKKVKEIRFIGEEEVGCIDVEKYHQFTANGIISGNSELPLCIFDSCRLLVQNLYSYIKNPFTKISEFLFALFYEHSKIAQRLMDDLIDLEIEKIDSILQKIESDPEKKEIKNEEIFLWKSIKEKCINGRRTGLGITAEGDMLAALNIKYGSDESIKFVENIHKIQKLASYTSSMEMAKEIGPFPIWDKELDKKSAFIQQIKKDDEELYNNIMKYGRRNICNLTCAPTGSVSILTQTTSGIEPLFSLEPYIRRKKINPSEKGVKVDFIDGNGDQWQEFKVYHSKVEEWMKITEENDIKKSPWYGATANDIDWGKRVKLQAAIQKHVDHSISSTLNLPYSATEEDVAKIYETAWLNGCKGVTVYRDGCRSGVLIKNKSNKITKTSAPKRPKELFGEIHHFILNKQKYYVAAGFYENDLYEIFTSINADNDGELIIPRNISKGKIVKETRGKYLLIVDKEKYELTNGHSDDTADSLTRLISCALRHGADVSIIVHQLEKTRGPMISFSKILARTLKKYIKDGTEVFGEECPSCKQKLIRSDGCISCQSCGWTKC